MAKIVPLFLVLCSVLFVLVARSHVLSSRASHEIHLRGGTLKHTKKLRNNDTEPARQQNVSKRFSSSRWTNYIAGLGACGITNTNSDFIVALNAAQFGSGEQCFKMITMSYNGKSAQAQITDMCPGCTYGGLDLTPGLFQFFANLDDGVVYGSWDFANASPSPTTSSALPPTIISTSQYIPPSTSSTPKPTSSSSVPNSPSAPSGASSTSSPTSSVSTLMPVATSDNSLLNELNLITIQMANLVACGAHHSTNLTTG